MEKVEEIAREVGFQLVGMAPARGPRDGERFEAWLAKGYAGEMEYLERNRERILAPDRLVPQGKTILSLGLSHARAPYSTPEGASIARYALGRDYHNLIGRMLEKLKKLLLRAGLVREARSVVDAGPLLERSHAAEAGLGFPSKSANLLHPDFGPWIFLAELVVDAEWPATSAPVFPSCGTCTACLDACPTGAIVAPHEVDARKCISYLTIESRGVIEPDLREDIGNWVFGCDICSEVCPFGEKSPDTSELWGMHSSVESFRLVDWATMDPEDFPAATQASALKRPGWRGMVRNALIVLGNQQDPDTIPTVNQRMQEADPLLRRHAAWALGKLGARRELEAAKARETTEEVLREIDAALLS